MTDKKPEELKLIKAAENGMLKQVRELLDTGVDVNAINHIGNGFCGGYTALMKACAMGHADIVLFLLSRGADVNMSDINGNTALMRTVGNGYVDIVRILLEHGANVGLCNTDGFTALMRTCRWGYGEEVRLLLEYGADVNTCGEYGNTALTAASQKGYEGTVQILFEHNADPNIADNNGNTALIEACKNCHLNTVLQLLEHGADVNHKNNLGFTALLTICMWYRTKDRCGTGKNKEITEALLNHGADVNISNDSNKWTPLMYLAWRGRIRLMKTLVKAGANINSTDNDGQTALDILGKWYPKKHDKWIMQTVVKQRCKKLRQEDLAIRSEQPVDWNI